MIVLHLPDPIGWIALSPEALREAQKQAQPLIGVAASSAVPAKRDCALVSAEEAAEALGVEASWLLRRARMRKVPFSKVGKYCRFNIEELRAHFAKATQE